MELLDCEIMQVSKEQLFEMQAELCGLMANPKRLMILDYLSQEGEANVGQIAEALELSMPVVSQHLRLMRDGNVVVSRKSGHCVCYRLKHPGLMTGCHAVRDVLHEELKARGQMAEFIAGQNE